jgi:altronate dehydratase
MGFERRFPLIGGPLTDNVLIIHPRDNVAVALRDLTPGEEAKGTGLSGLPVLHAIPAGHKIALRDLASGEEIVKYGEVVAVAARAIHKGEWVHTHNLESKRWRK